MFAQGWVVISRASSDCVPWPPTASCSSSPCSHDFPPRHLLAFPSAQPHNPRSAQEDHASRIAIFSRITQAGSQHLRGSRKQNSYRSSGAQRRSPADPCKGSTCSPAAFPALASIPPICTLNPRACIKNPHSEQQSRVRSMRTDKRDARGCERFGAMEVGPTRKDPGEAADIPHPTIQLTRARASAAAPGYARAAACRFRPPRWHAAPSLGAS
jgi:hypothetical protein